MLRVGLTGGIGSGKSTASRVFEALGVPVYNSDERAKYLMNNDPHIISRITEAFGSQTYRQGRLDPPYLASVVFTDREKLALLNSIVHPAVMDDFRKWAQEKQDEGHSYVVQENAILFDAGFDRSVDVTVTISAPVGERIARAAGRDKVSGQKVRDRIANQMSDRERESRAHHVIHNADTDLMLPQIVALHENLVAQANVAGEKTFQVGSVEKGCK